MSQIRPLDVVIRKVEAGVQPGSSAETIVIINNKKKKAADKGSFIERVRGELSYYLVANLSDHDNVARYYIPVFNIEDIENNRSIGLRVGYWASCDPGNEKSVAEALCDGDHPGAVLEKIIKKYINEFINNNPARFIDDYFSQRMPLQEKIRDRARDELSLNLTVKIHLDGEELALQPLKINTRFFPVRVEDYDEEQSLQVVCELPVNEPNKINAVAYRYRAPMLESVIKEEVGNFFGEHVSLEMFCTELNENRVISELNKRLNAKLLQEGRRVGFLALKTQASSEQSFFAEEIDIDYRIQEFPKPITIKNKVIMVRHSIARYKAKNSPKLDEWLKAKLDRIIPEVLFEKKYIDLLLRFQPLEMEIKESLVREAEAIGYSIRQLITGPNLEPFTWLKKFTLESQPEERKFETRLSKFYVELSLYIVVRIKDLRDIESRLNQQQDVPKLMKEAALSVTRQYLHGVDPERFYMRFNYSDPDEHPNEVPVERELIYKIREVLEQEFHAEVIEIIPKIARNEIIRRWEELQESISEFQFSVTPFRGGEPVLFRGNFQVDAIDSKGWSKFHQRKFGIDDIRRYLENHIIAKLKAVSAEELVFKGLKHQRELENVVRQLATRCVREKFGLIISVDNLDRGHTKIELAANQELIDRTLARLEAAQTFRESGKEADIAINLAKQDQLNKLLQAKINLTGQEGVEDELEELDRKISEIRSSFEPDMIPSIETVERSLQQDLPGEMRLIDVNKFKALPSGSPRAQKNGSGEEEDEEQ
jgi:hypothetical protein